MLKEELAEKISKEFEKDEKVKKAVKGDYITSYKKIGNFKAVSKTLNIKPDLIIEYFTGGFDYAFITESLFDCLKILGEFALFKELQIEFDCKKILLYFQDDEYLYKVEEMGLTTSHETYKISNESNALSNITKWYSEKIGKEVIIKKVEYF